MAPEMLKQLLDACFVAKRITELMPKLPKGLTPRHIHVIDAILMASLKLDRVHPRDVCELLHLTPPSVTRLLGELAGMGYVDKKCESDDKRFVSLTLTPRGRAIHKDMIELFQKRISKMLSKVSNEECQTAIRVITTLHHQMEVFVADCK